MKNAILVAIIYVLMSSLVHSDRVMNYNDYETISAVELAQKVSAENAGYENHFASKSHFTSIIYDITGEIISIGKDDFDIPFIVLEGDNVNTLNVLVSFLKKHDLSFLNIGQTVTVNAHLYNHDEQYLYMLCWIAGIYDTEIKLDNADIHNLDKPTLNIAATDLSRAIISHPHRYFEDYFSRYFRTFIVTGEVYWKGYESSKIAIAFQGHDDKSFVQVWFNDNDRTNHYYQIAYDDGYTDLECEETDYYQDHLTFIKEYKKMSSIKVGDTTTVKGYYQYLWKRPILSQQQSSNYFDEPIYDTIDTINVVIIGAATVE
ncbi:MAG: hypothetical protein FWG20_07195 [Candidatus Cloacimonetes bacterium]|nr:hypothetical protein [Candidatus Cloacimonadota bacterium]